MEMPLEASYVYLISVLSSKKSESMFSLFDTAPSKNCTVGITFRKDSVESPVCLVASIYWWTAYDPPPLGRFL